MKFAVGVIKAAMLSWRSEQYRNSLTALLGDDLVRFAAGIAAAVNGAA
jgi:hypothetical protein